VTADREAAIRGRDRSRMKRGDMSLAIDALLAELDAAREQNRLLQTLRVKAKTAKSVAAAPDYDEEAIRDALWAVVDAALGAPECDCDAALKEPHRSDCPALAVTEGES
jgi:hypothetical protein